LHAVDNNSLPLAIGRDSPSVELDVHAAVDLGTCRGSVAKAVDATVYDSGRASPIAGSSHYTGVDAPDHVGGCDVVGVKGADGDFARTGSWIANDATTIANHDGAGRRRDVTFVVDNDAAASKPRATVCRLSVW